MTPKDVLELGYDYLTDPNCLSEVEKIEIDSDRDYRHIFLLGLFKHHLKYRKEGGMPPEVVNHASRTVYSSLMRLNDKDQKQFVRVIWKKVLGNLPKVEAGTLRLTGAANLGKLHVFLGWNIDESYKRTAAHMSEKYQSEYLNATCDEKWEERCKEIKKRLKKNDSKEIDLPNKLKLLIEEVVYLKNDTRNSKEFDHDVLVGRFLEYLGYRHGIEIKFQVTTSRANRLDLIGYKDNMPQIICEDKTFRKFNPKKDYEQLFNYYPDTMPKWGILTNSDHYIVYDSDKQLVGDFTLTNLTREDLKLINRLKKTK